MIQIVDKWQINIQFPNDKLILFIYDNRLSNVLRKFSDIEFMQVPLSIKIEKVVTNIIQEGVAMK